MSHKIYKICRTCLVHHIENCGTCYGFGVYKDGRGVVPVSAHEAHTKDFGTRDPVACPECGSTYKGLPDGVSGKG